MQNTVKFKAVQGIELLCIKKQYILKHCSAVQCSAVEGTAAPNPLKQKKSLYVSFCIGVSIRIGREIRCLPYAGFFFYFFELESSTNKYFFLN